MALTCARCGTQNPDGNSFCQACGAQLAAVVPVAPAGPPPGTPAPIMGPPPNIPPPSYQSPYYTPDAAMAQPPVHRTPWVLLISAVVGLVLVMGACGTALAIVNSRNASQTSSSGLGSGLPSPTPATSPSPIAKGSPTSGNGKVSNSSLSVTVPAGWLVANKDSETITLVDSSGDSVTIGSGPSDPSQTAQQNKDTLDAYLKGKYPDTKTCPNTKVTTGSMRGAPGIFWTLCFTLTSGGQSLLAAAPLFAGANKDGSVYYAVILLSPVSDMNNFILAAQPILSSIQWALK